MHVLSPALPFSEQLRLHFHANGFAVVRDILPHEVVAEMRRTARELVTRAGKDIRHSNDGHVLSYRVVTGEVIREKFPELFSFYQAPEVREWIRDVIGADGVHLSKNLRSAVNINCMRETGHIYRWHFDAVRYTAILFLTTSAPADGGALEMAIRDVDRNELLPLKGAEFSIVPQAGTLLLMDGTRCLHRAAPLLRDTLRLTVPMVYPVIADDARPEGLDDYLYQPRRHD